jgi:integrase
VDEALAQKLVSAWHSRLRSNGSPERFGFAGQLAGSKSSLVDVTSADDVSRAAAMHVQEVIELFGKPITDESYGIVQRVLSRQIPHIYSAGFWSDVGDERAFAVPRMKADVELAKLLAEEGGNVSCPSSKRPTFNFHDAWLAWSAVTATNSRTVQDTRGVLKQLATFLGHDDAIQLGKADVIRWRDHAKGNGISNNTWNNRVASLTQVFERAVADDLLPSNPFVKTRLPKAPNEARRPYTDAEAVRILQAARREVRPSLRWSHWVMAFTGMRVAEVLQLTGSDIQTDQLTGVSFIRIATDVKAGKSVKTGVTRHVPLHPSLIEEGFLDFARAIAPSEALFADKKPDKFGRLGGRAWNVVGVWVRETVGITDPQTAPNHSWRHRMEDELRTVEVYEADRDAIVGHARKTTGAKYGIKGEALSRLHRELSKVRPPRGL